MRHGLAVMVVIVLLAPACQGDDNPSSEATTTRTVTVSTGGGGDMFEPVPRIVDQVQPSVVSVVTEQGQGSGVVFDADQGYVITNDHVAGGAGRLEIVLASGETVPARLRASTDRFDIAVLDVDRNDLPAATFVTELPRVGSLAIAMGNPAGFENSVTAGIISGLNREIPAGGSTPALVDLIQTDAAISPGNSGGALVDRNGDVIGINVAYLPPQQGAVSLGFAIPAPIAMNVARQLIETGEVEFAYIGIEPVQVTPELGEAFDLGTETGVLVQRVVPDGPADNAGVQQRDVIVQMADRKIELVEDLFAELRDHAPGEKVTLTVVRRGDRRELDVTLGELPSQ
jgi:S1-C subfamily serine protease